MWRQGQPGVGHSASGITLVASDRNQASSPSRSNSHAWAIVPVGGDTSFTGHSLHQLDIWDQQQLTHIGGGHDRRGVVECSSCAHGREATRGQPPGRRYRPAARAHMSAGDCGTR